MVNNLGSDIAMKSPKGPRSAVPVDLHVGQRVKARRMLLAMTQEELADKLGVTFQQVQKYEKGVNRVSASRLLSLSQVLRVPVQYFFDERPDDDMKPKRRRSAAASESGGNRDGVFSSQASALMEAFDRIRDRDIRQALVDHVGTLAASLEK